MESNDTLLPMVSGRPVSPLLLEELFEARDPEFFNYLLSLGPDAKRFVGFAEKFKKDSSPFARKQKLQFARHTSFTKDHRLVFKRLFKHAIAQQDHELVATFMVTLDRMIRRRRRRTYTYDRSIRTTIEGETLRNQRRNITEMFSHPTVFFLRRRAWRYFRKIGFSDASAYLQAVTFALVAYTDADVARGENLLDNWGLMHCCFGKSPLLAFHHRHTNVKPDASLATISAAPMFERHWADAQATGVLLDLLLRAQCRPVRVWAIQLLKRHHSASLARLDADRLLELVSHWDQDVAAFAAELLGNATTLAALPVPTWMRLLQTTNATVITPLVDAFRKHVDFNRLTLAQAIELTTRAAVPVARLGLEIVSSRPIKTDDDRAQLIRLAQAQCPAVAAFIAQYALPRLNSPGVYQLDQVIPFFDSHVKSMREGSFQALADQSPASTDPAFWARLFESPYDDVRHQLVHRLQVRSSLPGASNDSLALLWQSVLLNIHRGGRSKLTALRQISDHIRRQPESARQLLPVFAIAIRSVRAPEARHGLSAIVTAVHHTPGLEPLVAGLFPELQLALAGGVR
jgi:hypothetical protein